MSQSERLLPLAPRVPLYFTGAVTWQFGFNPNYRSDAPKEIATALVDQCGYIDVGNVLTKIYDLNEKEAKTPQHNKMTVSIMFGFTDFTVSANLRPSGTLGLNYENALAHGWAMIVADLKKSGGLFEDEDTR